jgi:DNA-binding XRE family transcriptional regulator
VTETMTIAPDAAPGAAADPGRAFGRSVRRRRLARGWTPVRLAAEAGISLAAVHSVETGRYSPGLSVAYRIAGALEASLDAMIGEEMPPVTVTPEGEATCRCGKPILRCATQRPHSGCSSGYGWIHAAPNWGHSCQPRTGSPYARPQGAS